MTFDLENISRSRSGSVSFASIRKRDVVASEMSSSAHADTRFAQVLGNTSSRRLSPSKRCSACKMTV